MLTTTGLVVVAIGLAIVFGTFLHLLINARSLMRAMRPLSDGEIKVGQGEQGPSRKTMIASLVLHFVGWAIAGFAYLTMLADVEASAPPPASETSAAVGE
ncbi:hypothetical protein GRI40_05470 [Altererythrobacter aerius]|uniref:Uncharacterized protein n=1 Tax=Tsuneonella aeria TaxID=1837929 RepID=A0A6I4TEU1_9SPHN|nr:hypothetical protein [Tsuneonella aeria]MXO74670.1 hypothetical protein [Tsuneonella aeria]